MENVQQNPEDIFTFTIEYEAVIRIRVFHTHTQIRTYELVME